MRVTVGLPLLPSTPSFLPLIFFPQLGHDSSNSRNWSCNNLLSGIHRRSSPDQSVITLFLVLPSLPSPGYLRDHRTRNPLLLSLSLPLSLFFLSREKSSISIERGSRGRGSERGFPKQKRIYRVSLFPLIKNKNRGKHRERRCGGLSSFVCTKRGKKLAVRILLLSPSSMDRALLSFFLFFIETADLN